MDVDGPDWDLLSSYAGLLALAVLSIYAGSRGSVTDKQVRVATGKETDVAEEEEEEELPDRIGSSDAYLFPIVGSMVLFGLYVVVKYLGEGWINWLLQWYFAVVGIGSVAKSLISLVKWTMGSERWRKFEKTEILVLKGPRELASVSMRTPAWYLLPIGALTSILYSFGPSTTRRSALLTDILALSFSHNALSLIKIDSFKTGCVLLSGLFLYDIWWVFGTEVMVHVASTLDIPIKVLWPKSIVFSTARGFTMLGLGDIVVPGLFIALALRYDYHRASQQHDSPSVRKPYFYSALLAYVAGLGTTIVVMHNFKTAQPALLYLSPACILSFFLTAFIRDEFKDAWAWSDEPEKKEDAVQTSTTTNGKTDGSAENGSVALEPTTSSLLEDGEEAGKDKKKKRKRKKE
ncbi:uncharacterized protein LAESUDRAFT_671953 [Laetiporus sulphureus 93-53]|uniref:Peptidase A22B, signal peptide peptidase n=1 Tax=Laetiporus sulphureus 93-53 TaxID=1314785 RepID=A0A165GP94_9APHY|nr:uncharacterized protein LAESUDRAFT_671953 [Laetiporus sulphureus 93-53]KZT10619.1 hypothetical protein LAESUDRAFT_671953 [Laetiporus sulphureus 93-53]